MTVMGAADVPGSCCAKAAGPPLAAAARPAPIALTISRRDGDMDGPSAISAKAYQVAGGAAIRQRVEGPSPASGSTQAGKAACGLKIDGVRRHAPGDKLGHLLDGVECLMLDRLGREACRVRRGD